MIQKKTFKERVYDYTLYIKHFILNIGQNKKIKKKKNKIKIEVKEYIFDDYVLVRDLGPHNETKTELFKYKKLIENQTKHLLNDVLDVYDTSLELLKNQNFKKIDLFGNSYQNIRMALPYTGNEIRQIFNYQTAIDILLENRKFFSTVLNPVLESTSWSSYHSLLTRRRGTRARRRWDCW